MSETQSADEITKPPSQTIAELQKEIGEWALRKGWEFNLTNTPEKIALMHSELSEALEEYRKGIEPIEVYFEGKKPCGIGIELADTIIRILHYAAVFKLDMAELIEEKMAYNETRPFRHGNKLI